MSSTIESVLHETRLFPPSPEFVQQANVSGIEACRDLCAEAERVLITMPMSIEVVEARQACARIGATNCVVFGGFSAKILPERIVDAGATEVITVDGQFRGGREIPLKTVIDEAFALGGCETVRRDRCAGLLE